MIPRKLLKADFKPYKIDEEKYQRFRVMRQAFATVSYADTGEWNRLGWLDKMLKRMNERIVKGDKGFSQMAQAFNCGAGAFDHLVGQGGQPNTPLMAWNPDEDPDRGFGRHVDLPAHDLTDQVKAAASLYGADLTGVAKLDQRWIYSEHLGKPIVITEGDVPQETDQAYEIPKTINRAIVMAFVMDEDLLKQSPGIDGDVATSLGYSRMGVTVVSLARFIRALGYHAIPSMNDTALSIPLAIDAGLGQLGRHGLLITPEYGTNVRLGKVLTDMPLEADSPIDFGVTDFCKNCLLCAKSCPSDSISRGERTMETDVETGNSGVLKWYVHGESCLRFWQENGTSCSNCIVACPFTTGFEWTNCMDCETCEIHDGSCSLQTNTEQRKEYGYLEDGPWGDSPKGIRPKRRGL